MSTYKLSYTLESIASLSSVKVVVSEYVPYNNIILKQPKDLSRPPSLNPVIIASFHLSIWDLESGEVKGDCDPTKATEWYMSPERFKELEKLVMEASNK